MAQPNYDNPAFHTQKTYYSHIGGNNIDNNADYIDKQNKILKNNHQSAIGKIPKNIVPIPNDSVIQNVRYNKTHQTTRNEDKEYNPYIDFLQNKGLKIGLGKFKI